MTLDIRSVSFKGDRSRRKDSYIKINKLMEEGDRRSKDYLKYSEYHITYSIVYYANIVS